MPWIHKLIDILTSVVSDMLKASKVSPKESTDGDEVVSSSIGSKR